MDDIFMNFLPIEVTHAANATTLVETEVSTGMTPFSNRPWGMSIALVEFGRRLPASETADNMHRMILSTRQGLSSTPNFVDQGVIAESNLVTTLTTSGWTSFYNLDRQQFLPTVLVATPKLSLYASASADSAAYQSQKEMCRIGFLTVEMTQQLWNEVAQTWALEN